MVQWQGSRSIIEMDSIEARDIFIAEYRNYKVLNEVCVQWS